MSRRTQVETLFEVPEEMWVRRVCPVCGCALCKTYEYTYLVQRQGWVKIGATNRPRKRLNELARVDWANYCLWPEGMDWHQPLRTLLVLGGDIEHELHQRFRKQHVIGEWFLPGGDIQDWLEEVRA